MSDPLYLDDIKNFEDNTEITDLSTLAETDIMTVTDVSEPGDYKITLANLWAYFRDYLNAAQKTIAQTISAIWTFSAAPVFSDGVTRVFNDWSTYDTSTVLDDGKEIWFYNNSELGSSTKFFVIGDGSTQIGALSKFTPVEAETEFRTDTSTKATNKISYTAVSTTVARLVFQFDGIPKQDATAATLTYDTFRLLGIGGSIFNLTHDEILGVPMVDGKEVYIDITDTVNSPFGIGDGIVSRVDNVVLTLS
ncbi:MAG: hypothetical protein PQJ60_10905 [Spirochaetales bacterium]|nr:hypothetical protein [Spirochaetales bacterium]